jgi:hypothetical protein
MVSMPGRPANKQLQRTKRGSVGASPLNCVFGGPTSMESDLRGERLPRVVLTLVVVLCSCVRIGGTQERRILDLGTGDIAAKVQIVKAYVSEEQLQSLRTRARAKYPALSDRDIATIGLQWQRGVFADGEHVMIVVTFMPDGKEDIAAGVADYLLDTVGNDLRERVGHKKAAEQSVEADEPRIAGRARLAA